MKKKLTYVVSDIDKALAFEWVADYFREAFDLSFIIIGKEETAIGAFLKTKQIRYWEVSDRSYPGLTEKILRVYTILKNEHPDIVHIHLWRAMLVALPVSWFLRIKKRIFTRHHAIIHYVQYPSGRKWDRLCNALATDIVAVSQNVKNVLIDKDKARSSKIHVIHHGFDLSYFTNVSSQRIEAVRRRYSIPEGRPVIGVISRYLELKGISYTIDAFKKIRLDYPDAHLILANTDGDYAAQIKNDLQQLPANSYTEIKFEDDLAALYRIFDVFVHVPVDLHSEAFGQTYIEPLISGISSVFTLSGVAPDFIKHQQNALVVNYRDSNGIALAVKRLLEEPGLAPLLTENGKRSVQAFALQNMLSNLEVLYAR